MYVIPKSKVRLMSSQNHFRGLRGGNHHIDHKSTWLTSSNGTTLEVPYHHSNNLPMLFKAQSQSCASRCLDFDDLSSAEIYMNVSYERNQNLSVVEKELLHRHRLCGHVNFQ